jgi:hypothetical protein
MRKSGFWGKAVVLAKARIRLLKAKNRPFKLDLVDRMISDAIGSAD